jgi:hypothetical protein
MTQRPNEFAEIQTPDPFDLPFARSIERAGLIGGLALLGWAIVVASH